MQFLIFIKLSDIKVNNTLSAQHLLHTCKKLIKCNILFGYTKMGGGGGPGGGGPPGGG